MESRLLLKTLFLYVERELYVSRKKLSIKLERDKVKYCVFCDIVKNSEKYFLREYKILRTYIHDVCISGVNTNFSLL